VDQGPYSTTPYATVTAAAATTNYNSYVSNSSGAPFISSAFVDSAYTDLAATQCVPYPKGSAPNWYSNGHGYGYKVTAVVGGVETAKSSAMTASLYRYGTRIMLLDSFNPIGSNNPNYAATDGGVTPSGATQTMKVSPGGQTYINPYCGNGCPEWLMETKQFNYMVFVIKGTPNHFPVMWPEVVGDYSYQLLNHGGGTSISSGTWSSTTYTTVKVALGGPSGLMTDYTSGAAVRLSAWYKCTLDAQASGTYWIADWYFSET
jgi:hypothetical protein